MAVMAASLFVVSSSADDCCPGSLVAVALQWVHDEGSSSFFQQYVAGSSDYH